MVMLRPTRKNLLLILLAIVAGGILLFSAYVWLALHWSYSDGERAGYVQKFSSKGWICKTWEGELSLVAIPGAAPEKFLFTVRDDAVAQQVGVYAFDGRCRRFAGHAGGRRNNRGRG